MRESLLCFHLLFYLKARGPAVGYLCVTQSLAGLGVGGLPGMVLLLAEDRSPEKRAV